MMLFATLNYLYSSVFFYLLSKIVCSVVSFRRASMTHKRSTTLSSIPEKSEVDEENKWVPKKKHEVLKAKYKCLKKLFQIYDASVIGMLPEPYAAGDAVEDSDESGRKSRKRKRCHRVKLDACAGTSEHEIETAVQVAASKTTCVSESCTKVPSTKVFAATQAQPSRDSLLPSEHGCACAHNTDVVFQSAHFCPRARMCRQRKRTGFQSFMQRLLGIRSPNPHRGCALPPGGGAVSECDMHHHSLERRRRRRLRFRRMRRPTRAHSESVMRAPPPAHCAQVVQRNCLLDTTPRQCPIAGCRMMLYGIINYNDHLNLCHFTSRRNVCHFCHEGFEREENKQQHENEHIGVSLPPPPTPLPCRSGITSVTQTDPEPVKEQDEKLKKIVSFFDKIVDSTQMLTDMKKSRHSDMNLRTNKTPTDTQTEASSACDGHSKLNSSCSDVTAKRQTFSCNDLRRGRNNYRSAASDAMSQCCSANCNFCGDNFDYGQSLERKFGEFRSCGALPARRGGGARAEDGHVTVTSDGFSALELTDCASSVTQSSLGNGVISLMDNYEDAKPNRKPSTNVVFSASECSRRVSTRSLADRFKSYKWEPCTRIIRV